MMKAVQSLMSSSHYHIMALGFLTGLMIFLFCQLVCFAAEQAPLITPEQYIALPTVSSLSATDERIHNDALSDDAISYMLLEEGNSNFPRKLKQSNPFSRSCRQRGAWVSCP